MPRHMKAPIDTGPGWHDSIRFIYAKEIIYKLRGFLIDSSVHYTTSIDHALSISRGSMLPRLYSSVRGVLVSHLS